MAGDATRRASGGAFGKVILLGEHAVVHGTRALGAAVRRGVRAEATADGKGRLSIGQRRFEAGDTSLESKAFAALAQSLESPLHSVEVSVDLPLGVGLGASAAIGVALARSLGGVLTTMPSREAILTSVDAWERVFHGNPSGIDAAIAYAGGCVGFRRGRPAEHLPVKAPIEIVIGIAGEKASTKEMVELVARFATDKSARFQCILAQIEALVTRAERAIANGEFGELGALLDENQRYLMEIGVSTDGIERACQLARQAGAAGAKLTGAGGGGSVIALSEPGQSDAILRAWQAASIPTFATHIEAASPSL